MAVPFPYPIDDTPRPRAHDLPIPFTTGLLLEFREATQQRDDKLAELERDIKLIRQRLSRYEHEAEESAVTLEQHDDRLDALEFTCPDGRATTGTAPARLLIAQPIDPRGPDRALGELNRAMGLIVEGLSIYCRHGVDLADLMQRVFPLFAAAAERVAADHEKDGPR